MASTPAIPAKQPSLGSEYHRLYAEYKRDTNAVATWLAASTKFCTSATDESPNKKPAGRLKGKARKLAQEETKEAKPASKYTIATAHWIPMTRMLAESDQKIDVPMSVVTTLRRAISLRKKVSETVQQASGERKVADATSDDAHQHFVSILDEVLKLLEARAGKAAIASPGSTRKGKRKAPPSGQYSALDVEEPSQAFLDAPDVVLPPPVPSDNNIYEAQIPRTWEEVYASFHFMTMELQVLQESVADIWKQYLDGGISLVTAALTSRATNDLGREVIERHLPDFEDFEGPFGVGPFGVAHQYSVTEISFRSPFQLRYLEHCQGLSKKAFLLEALSLEPGLVLDQGFQTFYSANLGLYECLEEYGKERTKAWVVDPGDSMWTKRFKEDFQYLDDVFATSIASLENKSTVNCKDEDVCSIISRAVNPNSAIHSDYSLTFVCWTLLTIKRAFKDKNLAMAFEKDMKAQIQNLRDEILHLEWILSRIEMEYPRDEETCGLLQDLWQRLAGVEEDALRGAWDLSSMPQENLSLLKISPSYCGIVLYETRRRLYTSSLVLVKKSAHLLAMAHLHNALDQFGLMKYPWKDMERCLETIGMDNIFLGGKPKAPAVVDRIYMAAGGTASSIMARKQRRSVQKWLSGKEIRGPTDKLTMMQHFRNRGQWDGVAMTQSIALSAIAESSLVEVETLHQGALVLVLVPGDAGKQKKGKAEAKAVSEGFGNSSKANPPLGGEMPNQTILRSLALRIEPESAALSFPLYQFYRSLHNLFDLISAEEGMKTPPEYSNYIVNPFSMVFDNIFGSLEVPLRPAALRKAAEVLNKWLGEGKGGAASICQDDSNKRGMVGAGAASSSGAEDPEGLALWKLSLEGSRREW